MFNKEKYQKEYRKRPGKKERKNFLERERRKKEKLINPDKRKLQMRIYFLKYPWAKSRSSVRGRAKKKSLECTIRTPDFKKMWFRDKAYLMKRPSVDRVNPKKGYTFENCRYLELSLNSQRTRWIIISECPQCGFRKISKSCKNIEVGIKCKGGQNE